MKIAFLSYYSGVIDRGVETLVDSLASRLSKKHNVVVIQAGKIDKTRIYQQIRVNKRQPKIASINPTSLIRKLFIDKNSLQIGLFTLQTLNKLKDKGCDLIFPTNGGWQTLIVRIFCIFNKTKWVISGQSGLGWDERWNMLNKPNLYIAPSKVNLLWSKRYRKKRKSIVINNGVDIIRFASQAKLGAQKQILENWLRYPIKIITVAGQEKYKRVEETIKAVAHISDASLLVVGGSKETRRLGEELLSDRYTQTIFSHNQMPAVYQSADLFTLVSESSEAFGIVYLEAMAAGLPIVATDDLLRREIIGDAGLYVSNPGNSMEYAQIIRDGLAKKWGNRQLTQAKKFDWDIIADNYEKAFEQLLVA